MLLFLEKQKKLEGNALQEAAMQLGLKYNKNEKSVKDEIQKALARMSCFEIEIEHITGKQAIELVK